MSCQKCNPFRIGVCDKEFLALVKPVINWVSNCKNEFYESITYEVRKDIKAESGHTLCLSFFPADNRIRNSFVSMYQFHNEKDLVSKKELLKQLLKAKDEQAFKGLINKIEGY